MRESPPFGQRAVSIAVVLYIALVVVASFHFNISLTADRVAILLVIAALATGRIRSFLRDWSAFVIVILAWQVLQGMSNSFTHSKPHVTEMITLDKLLFFGQVPAVWLQQHFYHPGQVAWYDIAATCLYMFHFIFPLGAAFAFWFWRRDIFLQFMASFLFLALFGFATYVLYPAAPPWIAADWWHYLPHITKIFDQTVTIFGGQQSYSALTTWTWQHGGYDYFGAVPSEHAAFPFLCFLYARLAWPRAGWLVLAYSACVWVAVVYLGEHYVTDVIVGVFYAAIAYAGVQVAIRRSRQVSVRRLAASEGDRPDPRAESLPA